MPKKLQERGLNDLEEMDGDSGTSEKESGFDWESFIFNNKKPLTLFLVGLIFLGLGVIYFKVSGDSSPELEVIEEVNEENRTTSNIVVEIAGAVEKPGVYKLNTDSRIDDLLIVAGGVTVDADRDWMEKYLNRASILTDAQKIYIPSVDEQSNNESATIFSGSNGGSEVLGSGSETFININTATLKKLDSLPGIGPVYGQSIIDHRPYSTVEDLLTKGALKEYVYEKIKDLVSVY